MTRSSSLFFVALLVVLFSCELNKIDFSNNDSANIQNEFSVESNFLEAEDISSVAVSADNATAGGRESEGGRQIVVNDSRFECATVTLVPTSISITNPRGSITIDFGTGCQDKSGVTRKGKIVVTYSGRRFMPGSSTETTFIGYEVNGIKIEGTRTVTNQSGSLEARPIFETNMQGGKINWSDGSTTTREELIRREWIRGNNPANDVWYVTGSATGTNRAGIEYVSTITKALVYKKLCTVSKIFKPVEGTKEIVARGKKVTIDYGEGACDKTVTITVNGQSKKVEVKGD
ncbi:MAG: hypothetical protein K2U26_10300 [Cyclobacteriaceae bacterium]|nr:hypothetical protein [Cyclobacteriaceae bacterium]